MMEATISTTNEVIGDGRRAAISTINGMRGDGKTAVIRTTNEVRGDGMKAAIVLIVVTVLQERERERSTRKYMSATFDTVH